MPSGWEHVPGFGLRRTRTPGTSVGFRQEALPPEMSLQDYAKVQLQIMEKVLPAMEGKGPYPSSWPGAEEAVELMWRLTEPQRQFLVVQIYAKALGQVGIVTFTTTNAEFAEAASDFRAVREQLAFQPQPLPAPAEAAGQVNPR